MPKKIARCHRHSIDGLSDQTVQFVVDEEDPAANFGVKLQGSGYKRQPGEWRFPVLFQQGKPTDPLVSRTRCGVLSTGAESRWRQARDAGREVKRRVRPAWENGSLQLVGAVPDGRAAPSHGCIQDFSCRMARGSGPAPRVSRPLDPPAALRRSPPPRHGSCPPPRTPTRDGWTDSSRKAPPSCRASGRGGRRTRS